MNKSDQVQLNRKYWHVYYRQKSNIIYNVFYITLSRDTAFIFLLFAEDSYHNSPTSSQQAAYSALSCTTRRQEHIQTKRV